AFIFASLGVGSNSDPKDIIAAIQSSGISIIATFLSAVITALVQAFLYTGMYNAAIKQLRGGQISVGDFFGGMQHFVPILGVTALVGVAQFLGSLLCCVGIFVMLAAMGFLLFTSPLIVDRRMGTMQAIQASFDLTKQNWLMFILFGVVIHLLSGIGFIFCCVGWLVTGPLLFTTVACAYRDCFGTPGSYDAYTPPPPPSYGGYEPPPPPPPSSWQ
ncbi:MAG TPA: hypothetical protein VFZ34_10120, partial [Blastocatellia bacterium]|nr:hypothetical protein [Blastocatellia bacterium]